MACGGRRLCSGTAGVDGKGFSCFWGPGLCLGFIVLFDLPCLDLGH